MINEGAGSWIYNPKQIEQESSEKTIDDLENKESFKEYTIDIGNNEFINEGIMATFIEIELGVFKLKEGGFSVNSKHTDIAFAAWDEEVEDLSQPREMEYLGMADHLKWQEVELKLNAGISNIGTLDNNQWRNEFKASSIERLQEAFKHISIDGYELMDM